jgi:RsiW-degrading membrane proteinase PrsW (M82 family)
MAYATYTAILKLLNASTGLQSYTLMSTQETTIGREADCQIQLDSKQYPGVSRKHLLIRPLPALQAFELCDLNSGNGTYLNGQRVQGCQRLNSGDRISLGLNGASLTFELAQPSTPDTELTLGQIFPLAGTGTERLSKAYLVPGIVTVLFVVTLFQARNPAIYILALATYIALAAYYFVYQLCGKRKPMWEIVLAGVLEVIILISPIWSIAAFIFRRILPGNLSNVDSGGVISNFIHFWFGAGLLEELIKMLPVFLLLWVGQQWRTRRNIGVREPLDGILLGVACATAFTLVETLLQYVPNVVVQAGNQFGLGAGYLAGLQLLIPRVLGSIAGHLSYSGYFGYFVGLAVLKPRKRWQILSIGYLTSATLHALWNTFAGMGEIWMMLIGVASYVFLSTAILQARKLSPTRSENFATRMH